MRMKQMDVRQAVLLLFIIGKISSGFLVRGESSSSSSSSCTKQIQNKILTFNCSSNVPIEDLDIDEDEDWSEVERLFVVGTNGGRGPLTKIPSSICRLTKLKHLFLSKNQIKTSLFRFSSPCLSELKTLDLSHNYLRHIPTRWISQMTNLQDIKFNYNQLTEIPYHMFYNLSNVHIFEVTYNQLTTFELWLISIKSTINYLGNPVDRFSNNYNIDLSKFETPITQFIFFDHPQQKIQFDDSLFEMYNRCSEIHSNDTRILIQAIETIHSLGRNILNWTCSCAQYHLQKYLASNLPNVGCIQSCPSQSTFETSSIRPRLCKINESEPGVVPQYIECNLCDLNFLTNISDLETMSLEIFSRLNKSDSSNEFFVDRLVELIDLAEKKIQSNLSLIITPLAQQNFQEIIAYIETFITLIIEPLDIAIDSVAILTVRKETLITSFSQRQINQTSYEYFNEISTTNISIAQSSIETLSSQDIYTFYYLPSSFFRFASGDANAIIVSPIVGIHIPKNTSRLIEMIFTDIPRVSGSYYCVFWEYNHWNSSGCSHSFDPDRNRHICICNHTTSFALIFIPNKTIQQTYIPSITVGFLSIICFAISIVLSIFRQSIAFRHLSITNIFTLVNSIVFFCLLTGILIHGYRTKDSFDEHCSQSEENLGISTYFFLISTFASKTLLGICYFFTIFFHFIFIRLTMMSTLWLYLGFFLVILIALIPTIVMSVLVKQSSNLFVQYQGICWLNTSVVFRFVSIPLIVFLGLNALIILGITIRLIRFSFGQKPAKINEKRMMVSLMIWLALCVSLGMAWIFGPFLDVLIEDKEQQSSVIRQWIFAMFIGLEGVWVLIVNVVFYVNQRAKKNTR